MKASRWLLIACLALGPGLTAAADSRPGSVWHGTVTYVTDGDTLWVRPAHGGAPRKIRLDGIDAPEICQAFGVSSRQRLAGYVLGQQVRVSVRRLDDYQRELARVDMRGQDIAGWLVGQGLAWSYRFRSDPGPYARLEAQARAQKRGLFAQRHALRPRDFRKRHGSCH